MLLELNGVSAGYTGSSVLFDINIKDVAEKSDSASGLGGGDFEGQL